MFFPTFSPQGDGNVIDFGWSYPEGEVFPYFFPARGRKHPVGLEGQKGFHELRFFPTFSPQGDGNLRIGMWEQLRILPPSFSLLFPRKGTETQWEHKLHLNPEALEFFPTFSPQGDGNVAADAAWQRRRHRACFSLLFPRKGTETNFNDETFPCHMVFFPTFSPQGDGNDSEECH